LEVVEEEVVEELVSLLQVVEVVEEVINLRILLA
jgi:hypothetical protein